MRSRKQIWVAVPFVLALGWVGWLTWPASAAMLEYGAVTLLVVGVLVFAGVKCWRLARNHWVWGGLGLVLLVGVASLYLVGLVWWLRPDWMPQKTWYDFIENRSVTMRLVDETLVKVEEWEIMGDARQVLFVHPSPSGTTTLVYPVMIRAHTSFMTALAIAPGAWSGEGDGVVFSVYVEDDAGMHLLFSQYVDPKHQEQDRRWLPVNLSLSPYEGKLVRMIFSVSAGPAGDLRYDWSGWAEPRLVQSVWP